MLCLVRNWGGDGLGGFLMARGGPLDDSELMVIERLAEGLKQVEIAADLGWDPRTVNAIVTRLRTRFNFETNERMMYEFGRRRERMIRDGVDLSRAPGGRVMP